MQVILQESWPNMTWLINKERTRVCVCVCVAMVRGSNHIIHLNNANLLINGTRWTSEAEVVHRQYLIINQFAIVDTNYQASGKVTSFNQVWFETIENNYFYLLSTDLPSFCSKQTFALGGRVIIQEQKI